MAYGLSNEALARLILHCIAAYKETRPSKEYLAFLRALLKLIEEAEQRPVNLAERRAHDADVELAKLFKAEILPRLVA